MELAIAGIVLLIASLIGLLSSATGALDALNSIKSGYKLTAEERKSQLINRTSGFAAIAGILMTIAGIMIYFNVI